MIYVLQHQIYKDYDSFYNNNDFKQLLDTEEGGTTSFQGSPHNEVMRVADQYYKVCHKKIITLKYAGINALIAPTEATQPTPVSIANSHTWYSTFTMNLTKNVPHVLKYPESGSTSDPVSLNAPTNTSLIMCMGFVDEAGQNAFNNPSMPWASKAYIQQTYVSQMLYKDM